MKLNINLRATCVTLLACLCCGAACHGRQKEPPHDPGAPWRADPKTPFTLHDRFLDYLNTTYGPQSPLGPGLGAAWGQALDTPHAWGREWAGYGRRFASGYGRNVISNTIRLGVGALDHEDPRYYPSRETRIWPRARDAIIQMFLYHTDSGGRRFAFSAVAGSYGAAFVSNAWYPAPQADIEDALVRGSTAMASSIGYNEFREFWPDLRKLIHR